MDKPKPKVLKKKQQKTLGLYGLLERGTKIYWNTKTRD